MLGEACRQLRAWSDAGRRFPGRLWINLSTQQLDDPDTVAHIRTMTAEARVPPSSLGLELTESGLMADVEGAIRTMATLRADGFAIAIDDFGTGYSSLAYLKRLPADKLKIDLSFVRDMLRDHHDHTIVTTIIGAQPGPGSDRRRGRGTGPVASAARAWLRPGAGVSFRPAGAGRVCKHVADRGRRRRVGWTPRAHANVCAVLADLSRSSAYVLIGGR